MTEKKEIKKNVLSGFIWNYVAKMSSQIVSLVVSIILARLLSPDDYGAVAIVVVVVSMAGILVGEGMFSGLIQRKDVKDDDFSTMFVFGLVFSIVLYTVIFLIAPFIAKWYEVKGLCSALRVMGIQVVFLGVYNVVYAYISRDLDFKKFFLSTIAGTVVSAFLGIMMAYSGFGVWALITQYLSNTIVNTVLLVAIAKIRLRFHFAFSRFKSFFSYGWKVMSVSLLIQTDSEIKSFLIGKKFTLADLSYYNKGRELPNVIVNNINNTISSVILPTMSMHQNDCIQLKGITRKAVRLGTYVLTPFLLGGAAVAESLITMLLTEKWLPCVPYFRIMCCLYLLQPIQTAAIQAMKAVGRSDIYLKLQVVKTSISLLVMFFCVFHFGTVISIALGALVTEVIVTVINFPTNLRLIRYSYKEQIEDSFVLMIPGVVMALVVFSIQRLELSVIVTIIVQIIVGILVYALISKVFRVKEFFEIRDCVVGKMRTVFTHQKKVDE